MGRKTQKGDKVLHPVFVLMYGLPVQVDKAKTSAIIDKAQIAHEDNKDFPKDILLKQMNYASLWPKWSTVTFYHSPLIPKS